MAKQLLVGVWVDGTFKGSQLFDANSEGYDAFDRFLQQYSHANLYLIADAVEEDYRVENIPHTSGGAKRELIDRKLNQFYRNLTYRTAHFIGREKDKRRDDKYLFAALNNADFMQPWITVIQAADVALVGVYLLPMISQVVVRQLKLMAPHILLCEKLSSGLRQTYLHNGRLRMSRLVANVPENPQQLGYFYLVETEKTRLYLISQRLITRETPLNLVLVSTDDSTAQISHGISQEQGLICTDLNINSYVKSLNLPLKLVQKTPELVQMQLLANGHLVDNLAPAKLTQQYQFSQIKQWLSVSTYAVGILGAFISAWILYGGFMDRSAYSEALQDTKIQTHRYEDVAKDFPKTSISAADLQVAVALNETIERFPHSPIRSMQVLSEALENLPEITVDRLRWTLATEANIKDDDRTINIPENQQDSNNAQLNPITLDPTQPNELMFVTAEIDNFAGDYRAALDSVTRLVSVLKKNPRVILVEVLQEPVNVSSFANLQGSTTDESTEQKEPALFKLKIILRTPLALMTEAANTARQAANVGAN